MQTAPDPVKWGSLALSLLPFAPVIDGTVLTEHPLDAFAAGASADVDVLVGSNREESRLFLVAPGTIDLVDEPTLAGGAAAYGLSPEGLELYRANRPGRHPRRRAGRGGHRLVLRGPRDPARRGARGGRRDHLGLPVRPPGPRRTTTTSAPATRSRSRSCSTTSGSTRPQPLIGDTPSQAVADTAHAAWVAFVTSGDPGWAPYTTQTRTTGVLTEELTVVDDPDGDERATWDGIR